MGSEAEAVFREIDFCLPARGKIAAARATGRECARAWYAEHPELLPTKAYPDAISEWSPRCQYAWREGFVAGLRANRDAAGKDFEIA